MRYATPTGVGGMRSRVSRSGGGHAAQARVDGPDMTRMAVGPGGPDAVGGLLVPSGRSAPSRCLGSFRVSTGPAMVRAEPGRVTTLRQASAVRLRYWQFYVLSCCTLLVVDHFPCSLIFFEGRRNFVQAFFFSPSAAARICFTPAPPLVVRVGGPPGQARAGSCRASAGPGSHGGDVPGPGPGDARVGPGSSGDVVTGDGGRGAQPPGLWGVWAPPTLSSLAGVSCLCALRVGD